MPHEYIDWYSIKDPHPAALPNLQKIVTYMIAEKAVHSAHTLSIYAIAKFLDKQHKQAAALLRGRPGFIEVYRDGKMQGYYYDYVNFSETYPASYRDLKRTRVLLSEDVQASQAAIIKDLNDNFTERAKEFVKEGSKPSYPEFDLSNGPGKKAQVLVTFSVVDNPLPTIAEQMELIRLVSPKPGEPIHSSDEARLRRILSAILSGKVGPSV